MATASEHQDLGQGMDGNSPVPSAAVSPMTLHFKMTLWTLFRGRTVVFFYHLRFLTLLFAALVLSYAVPTYQGHILSLHEYLQNVLFGFGALLVFGVVMRFIICMVQLNDAAWLAPYKNTTAGLSAEGLTLQGDGQAHSLTWREIEIFSTPGAMDMLVPITGRQLVLSVGKSAKPAEAAFLRNIMESEHGQRN